MAFNHQLAAQIAVSILLISGACKLIKRGLVGPDFERMTYSGNDVLGGCIVLFIIFMMWY